MHKQESPSLRPMAAKFGPVAPHTASHGLLRESPITLTSITPPTMGRVGFQWPVVIMSPMALIRGLYRTSILLLVW